MRLDAERSSTYHIFAEYRADRPELQLEKRAAPAMKATGPGSARRGAGLGNAVLATQTFQHDPDLLLGRIMLARRPSDVLDNFLRRVLQWSGLLSHLRSYERYDEPETLPYSIRPFCPMSAVGGQGLHVFAPESCACHVSFKTAFLTGSRASGVNQRAHARAMVRNLEVAPCPLAT